MARFKHHKCRIRLFYSRGAFLVLVWNLLVCFVFGSLIQFYEYYAGLLVFTSVRTYAFLAVIPALCFMIAALLSGCLADTILGRYTVTRIGLVLVFLSTLLFCVNVLLVESGTLERNGLPTLFIASIPYTLLGIGFACFLATSPQLGLDQMPDASSENITSYISWFVFCVALGLWSGELLDNIKESCVAREVYSVYDQLWTLVLVLCMSVVLISDFILAPKWLIMEPKSPQYLKIMYQVLKFAAKHKAPLNRSAFTYWEEDIPSRLDLGKSRYGGPFTTEQVEDVKTFLHIFTVTLPVWIFCALIVTDPVIYVSNSLLGLTECRTEMAHLFGFSGQWIMVVLTLIYEFVYYPLGGRQLPNILQRIENGFFLLIVTYLLSLIFVLLIYAGFNAEAIGWISTIFFSIIIGGLTRTYLTSMLEFVCAQSPYGMRGLFTGFVYIQYIVPRAVNFGLSRVYTAMCTSRYCPVLYWSLMTAISLVGFLLFCAVARCYKRRVRENSYSPQRVVEEVYDRYLSQR